MTLNLFLRCAPFCFSFMVTVQVLLPRDLSAQVMSPSGSLGIQSSRTIFLDELIRVDFTPEQVFFLVAFPQIRPPQPSDVVNEIEPFSRHEAVLTAPFDPSAVGSLRSERARHQDNPATGSGAMQTWRAGVRVTVPASAQEVTYAVIVAARGNQFALVPPRTKQMSDASLYAGSITDLRASLLQRKAALRERQVEIDALDAELRRLRADADIIADLGRIVEVREEVSRAKGFVSDLRQDQENLRDFVRMVNMRPPPPNFAARERQLQQQIAHLARIENERADAAVAPAGTEPGTTPASELQRKLAVIERAQGLDIKRLRAEVAGISPHIASANRDDNLGSTEQGGESPDDYLR